MAGSKQETSIFLRKRRRINKETGTRKKKRKEIEKQREQKICISPWLRREGGGRRGVQIKGSTYTNLFYRSIQLIMPLFIYY